MTAQERKDYAVRRMKLAQVRHDLAKAEGNEAEENFAAFWETRWGIAAGVYFDLPLFLYFGDDEPTEKQRKWRTEHVARCERKALRKRKPSLFTAITF